MILSIYQSVFIHNFLSFLSVAFYQNNLVQSVIILPDKIHSMEPVQLDPKSSTEGLQKSSKNPLIINDVNNSDTGTEIEVMDKQCYLIRKAMDIKKQMTLFEDIQSKDKSPKDAPRALYPSPKTLLLGENEPSLKYEFGQKSVFNEMIDNANDLLVNRNLLTNDLYKYKSITVAAIEYPSPNGKFPAHIDHSNSFVYLLSVGCTANFMVQGPNMECKKIFKFNSGDLLVFNASTDAAILHAVINIDDETSCPVELGNTFPVLQKHRYGVQCRVHF